VVPAIATGCPVIVKPATSTPLSCLRFVELAHEAGLPPAWCQTLVVEDTALAEGLATHPGIAFLSFIGSAKVGWYLRSKLPPGARCALEHGGAAPVIVDRSVEVDAIVGQLVKGGYYHAAKSACPCSEFSFTRTSCLPFRTSADAFPGNFRQR
jgi:acyl-CoA reductase-like NAD-dependent aldehyde dehydrogenase